MTEWKKLEENDICMALFRHFHRRQAVTKCWRKVEGRWRVMDIAFIDDWAQKDYMELVQCLRRTAKAGGLVLGAFLDGQLKGFVSVEPEPLGGGGQYLDLSAIHVSEESRGKGIGKGLFLAAKQWAKERGAEKLYISAHSAVESQAFYRAMGCVEALEYQWSHVEKEPCDCQLECKL